MTRTFSSCRETNASGERPPRRPPPSCLVPSEVICVLLDMPVIAVMELFSLFVSVGVKGRPLQNERKKK